MNKTSAQEFQKTGFLELIPLIYPFLEPEKAKFLRIAVKESSFHKYLNLKLPSSKQEYFSHMSLKKIYQIHAISGELLSITLQTPLLKCFHQVFPFQADLNSLSGLNFNRGIDQLEISNNKELMLSAVKRNGCNLQFVSKSLQADPEIVKAAVKENINALKFASPLLKNNTDFLIGLAREIPEVLNTLNPIFRFMIQLNFSIEQLATDLNF